MRDPRIVPEVYALGVQHRCRRCGCHVNPDTHIPGSTECVDAALERERSIGR